MSYSPKSIVAYFTNWSIYGRKYLPEKIPVENLTHINYAFLDIQPDGHLKLTDPWADEQIWTNWQAPPGNLYGCLGTLFELKKKNRHLKVGFSIGGWTLSKNVSSVIADSVKRTNLIEDVISFILKYGMDFIDLDFEWLGEAANDGHIYTPQDGANYTIFLSELYEKLGMIPGNENHKRHYITMAAACGPDKYRHYEMAKIEPYVSKVLLMAYDFSGGWNSETEHQANLFKGDSKSGFDIDQAVKAYIAGGFPSNKLIIGAPLYSRSFANVEMGPDQDGYQQPFNGLPPGSFERGVYDYKDLIANTAPEWHDEDAGAAFKYNPSEKIWHSYDNEASLKQKLKYVQENNLGGIMFWELSGDMPKNDSKSLIKISANYFGRENLDTSKNNLYYPDTTWNNLKGFSANDHTPLPPVPVPVPVPSPPAPSPIPTPVPVPDNSICVCPLFEGNLTGQKRKRVAFEGKGEYNYETKICIFNGKVSVEYYE